MSEIRQRIAHNIDAVRSRIAAAAQRSGRSATDVTLVGVTKYVDVELTRLFPDAGCTVLGESRPQQLWEKAKRIPDPRVEWHLIGHLQRNKIRRTTPICTCIQSVDSLPLIELLERDGERRNQPMRALLEVNISGDRAKHGLTPPAALELAARLADLHYLRITGLMTIAALLSDAETAHADFAALRQLRDAMQARCGDTVSLSDLSMGMSRDFETAIEEGATIVRVGSALLEGVDGR